MNRSLVFLLLASLCPAWGSAQGVQRSAAIASSDILSQISMFNYQVGRKSDLLLQPTPIATTGTGKVEVEYANGNATIGASVERMPQPSSLGPYTTYVLWALTPDGRASNQGVIGGIEGGKGELDTLYSSSQFALIVTAEPHFAVSTPSDMIVLYNVADRVRATETKVSSLTERANYAQLAPVAVVDRTRPVDIVQAQYAVAIAEAAGAPQYAAAQFASAQQKFLEAQSAATARSSSDRRAAAALAREAVLAGEDARRAAMLGKAEADERMRREAALAEAARAAATEREAAARAAAAEREAAARAAEVDREAAAQAAAEAAQARERAAARQELLDRLNAVLPTRSTDRGLVSEIGGVQFATGTADLNAAARESLARFSGIVASYPDIALMIEGHTDSTGSDETNNALSLRRALSVRDYLIGQGVSASKVDAQGYGPTRPVDDNATADGRARNRRVEIIISGGPLVTQ
jgi:outer membrane protein OmpA-like peptidoglycan-associated protein